MNRREKLQVWEYLKERFGWRNDNLGDLKWEIELNLLKREMLWFEASEKIVVLRNMYQSLTSEQKDKFENIVYENLHEIEVFSLPQDILGHVFWIITKSSDIFEPEITSKETSFDRIMDFLKWLTLVIEEAKKE